MISSTLVSYTRVKNINFFSRKKTPLAMIPRASFNEDRFLSTYNLVEMIIVTSCLVSFD